MEHNYLFIKKYRFSFLCLLLLLIGNNVWAQIENNPPMRQVLGSAGGSGTIPSWGTIDYTVGEVMVVTDSTSLPFSVKWLTQGFQQPDGDGLSLDVISANSTCIGANNGSVNLAVISSAGTVTYSFDGSSFSRKPLYTDLKPGTYNYTVKDTSYTITGTVTITEDPKDCCKDRITLYKGFTPNSDGHNDTWVIDNITDLQQNKVSIYTRWGDLVWQKDNYNNNDVVWDGKNKGGNVLPDATYFYIVETGKNVCTKGWVELTH